VKHKIRRTNLESQLPPVPEVLGIGLEARIGITELSCGCGDGYGASDILLDSAKRCLYNMENNKH
jgi:hypothetical protein